MLGWPLRRSNSNSNSATERPSLTPAEKLKGYYDLAKEAGSRAIEADEQQQVPAALKLYGTALEIIREGLTLQVPSSGLSARADNVANWKQQLRSWQQGIQERVQHLQSPNSRSRGPSPPNAKHILRPDIPLAPDPVAPPPAAAAAGRAVAARPAAAATAAAGAQRQQPQQQRRQQGAPAAAAAGAATARAALSKDEERLRQIITADILEKAPSVTFDDIAGLKLAKQSLQEAVILPTLRADIFSGLRAPVRGILLYGPPGNGKTLLAKALATESRATFFNISAASLTSKWVGEGEKLVRVMFAMALERQPSIIFMDEIDSLLSTRSANEHDASRRLKTEFLVQFDGVGSSSEARVIVIGATNRPQELDDAVRRRLVKRIYIPLPDEEGRLAILTHLLAGSSVRHSLTRDQLARIVRSTSGYSASDLTALCREAALGPVRELGPAIASVRVDSIRPLKLSDFSDALQVIRPSLSQDQLKSFEAFTREYGTM